MRRIPAMEALESHLLDGCSSKFEDMAHQPFSGSVEGLKHGSFFHTLTGK
jgi:hypothetical protein